jgi:tetraacyldisaccharide 4'-kinase
MRLQTPRWWYDRDPEAHRLARTLLTPLGWVWGAATARRLARGERAKVEAPVICVGNLTVGGTGKTPVVRAVAQALAARGHQVHLLARGHGGSLAGPVRVDPEAHAASDVGDEPLMLAADYPTWIARDRAAGARAAVEGGAEVIVMDDGHQNPSLTIALSLVVVDGETRDEEWPFGDGRVFPAGPMREPLMVGLARADAAVVLLPIGMPVAEPDLLRGLAAKPVLVAHLQSAAPPPAGPQFGFAGVGKPWKVERALRAAGCDLVGFEAFADHAPYDAATLARLGGEAERLGAGLVTTEKDWARLPAEWRRRVAAWPVRAVFDDGAALADLLAGTGL